MRLLGIDPGCSATGWAIIETKPMSIIDIGTWRGGVEKIQQAAAKLAGYALTPEHKPVVAIQVPGLWHEKWPRFYGPRRNPKTGKMESGDKSGIGLAKQSMLAGWMCGMFVAAGWHVILCPSPKMRRKGPKVPVATFRADWGYSGTRTSEHARDAAYIALHGAGRDRA